MTDPGGTAWRRIAAALEAAIERGDYAAGDGLPSALVLAERYGVHRHTVRQAFRHLAERGLVSVARGRGTHVTERRFPYRLGRRVSLRTNFGAAGIIATNEVLGSALVDGEARHCAALGVPPGTRLWRSETVSLADGVPVGCGIHHKVAEGFPAFDAALIAASGSLSATLAHYGIDDYVRRSTRLSVRGADAREAALLKLEPGAPVMISDAVDALPDLTPVHLVESTFAGGRMEMVVEPFAE